MKKANFTYLEDPGIDPCHSFAWESLTPSLFGSILIPCLPCRWWGSFHCASFASVKFSTDSLFKTWQTHHKHPRPVKVGENNTGITTFSLFVVKVALDEGDAMTYDAQFAIFFHSCWS